MHQQVTQAIQSIADFSESDISMIIERVSLVNLQEGSYLLETNQVCSAFYFVNSGSLRHFYQTKALEEVNVDLAITGDWILDHQSFTARKPSTNNIVAFEDSTVIELSIHSLHELIGLSPSFFRLGIILEKASSNPYHADIKATPEEKYLKLLSVKPQLLQKFPLKQIASYLGITPETLSRVRRKISQ